MFEKRRLIMWRGLTIVLTTLFSIFLAMSMLISTFRTEIDGALGTVSQIIVTKDDGSDEDAYTYKSDYKNTKELVEAMAKVGQEMSREGSVLLKNENNALPLTTAEKGKLSLLGIQSYFPALGGQMGSSCSASGNEGTDAPNVDLVEALTNKAADGWAFNADLAKVYDDLKEEVKYTPTSGWNKTPVYGATTPGTSDSDVYFDNELTIDKMDAHKADWRNSLASNNIMIVTFTRQAGENKNYTPGLAGVDEKSKALNMTDPLGLSDNERALITEAVNAKKKNGGKVIVLLNNASAMEIEELKNNTDIDAMMQIGLPGGYGFYGVLDALADQTAPLGRLADTYAVVNANSPAAQNYGRMHFANYDHLNEYGAQINSYLVEAEGIYTGYKYYETRYADAIAGKGNATNSKGASNGATSWNYEDEVTYPFGYGLTYAKFTQTLKSVDVNVSERKVSTVVEVKNDSAFDSKDVIQLYAQAPYTAGGLEKSAIQLLDYEKVEVKANSSTTVTLESDLENLTSYDCNATNIKGTKGTFVLDGGDYYFTIGNGSHEAINNVLKKQGMSVSGNADNVQIKNITEDKITFGQTKNGTKVENQMQNADLNYWLPGTVTQLSRNDWAGTFPKTYTNITANAAMEKELANDLTAITENDTAGKVIFGADNKLKLADLKGVTDIEDIRWTKLMEQITLEECMERTALGGSTCKVIKSITAPEVVQNDGPNGYNSNTLGKRQNFSRNPDTDPYLVKEDDKNYNYNAGVMANATVIASTFSKEMANAYGEITGNYSIWSHLTILWGCGANLHRLPYNARNHEYYSEDPILTGYQGANYVIGAQKYGAVIGPKHFAFNDTEIDRQGIAPFMTEQKIRETEFRGFQIVFEVGEPLGGMTTFSRIGCTAMNSHYGAMMNVLRKEWGFKGMLSTDMANNTKYFSVKEYVKCGVTMSTKTGENYDAVIKNWPYWVVNDVAKDSELSAAVKQCMLWQNYAIANSNAMNGMTSNSTIVDVRTWYDNLLLAMQILFGLLTAGAIVMYVLTVLKNRD